MSVQTLVDVERSSQPSTTATRPLSWTCCAIEPQDARRVIDVSGRVGVEERGLRIAVRLVPGRRTAVEHRHQVGLVLLELTLEQVPEEVVVPIPAAVVVELDEEQVRPIDLLELRAPSPCCSSTASQSGAHMRSSTDVRRRKRRTRGSRRERYSARR